MISAPPSSFGGFQVRVTEVLVDSASSIGPSHFPGLSNTVILIGKLSDPSLFASLTS